MEQEQQYILETLKTLLGHMGIVFTDISVEFDAQTKSSRFSITTPDSGILIGENGDRLLALNHLMKRIAEHKYPEISSFMVDVNNYQKKRIDDIRAKAHMLAERARYFKSAVEMDPMSSYERMIVHAEFSESIDIQTESMGQGRDRRIIIRYKESTVIS